MTDNVRFLIDNYHDSASLTATSEALSIGYTQRSGRSYVWRSTSLDEQVINADMGGARYLSAVVIYAHNLSSTSLVRVEAFLYGESVYDSGAVNVSNLIPLGEFRFGVDPWGATTTDRLPTKQAPFWMDTILVDAYRITVTDPDNEDGYMQIGRIIAGDVVSPKYNAAYGIHLTWQDSSQHERTEAGSLRTIGGTVSRSLPIDFNILSSADRRRLTNAFLKNGKNADIYVSVFPDKGGIDEAEYAFLARRESDWGHTHNFFNNWQTQITLIEV